MTEQKLKDLVGAGFPPAFDEAPADPSGDWSREQLIRLLASRPTVRIMVPHTPDSERHEEASGGTAYAYIGYQGFPYPVPYGQMVEVPDLIAAIWEQSQARSRTSQHREARSTFIRMDLNTTDAEFTGRMRREAPPEPRE